jgi:hypothetical protein
MNSPRNTPKMGPAARLHFITSHYTKCGSGFIVTKGGDGTIHCCGEPMEQKR